MQNLKNPSNWYYVTNAEYSVYALDEKFANLLLANPSCEFYAKYYHPFAAILVNNQTKQVIAIRDHFAEEPFFYYVDSEQIIFASTIHDILTIQPCAIHQDQLLKNYDIGGLADFTEQTNYTGIFRLRPASELDFTTMHSTRYWDLAKLRDNNKLSLASDEEYIARFESLLLEALKYQMSGNHNVAVEFSGGVDSTAILCALTQLGIRPQLYTHYSAEDHEIHHEARMLNDIVEILKLDDKIDYATENFDARKVIDRCNHLFAGEIVSPSSIMTDPFHQKLNQAGIKIIFSGFGGDQCASTHAPLVPTLSEWVANGQSDLAYAELISLRKKKKLSINPLGLRLRLIKYTRLRVVVNAWLALRRKYESWHYARHGLIKDRTIHLKQYGNMFDYLYALVQGEYSNEFQFRIEETALKSKLDNFRCRYPLLYPPLVEFIFSLPLDQLRHNGEARLVIRCYTKKILGIEKQFDKKGQIYSASLDRSLQDFKSWDLTFPDNIQWLLNKLTIDQRQLLVYLRHYAQTSYKAPKNEKTY